MNGFTSYGRRWDRRIVMALVMLVAVWVGCKPSQPSQDSVADTKPEAAPQASPTEKPAEKPAPAVPALKTSRQVLDAMVARYKSATSYQDKAVVRLQGSAGDQKVDQSLDFSVALERPNKLRMEIYQGNVVCDGQFLWASSEFLPDQILKRPLPKTLGFLDIFADEMLASSLTQGPTQSFTWVPPQLLLLWADDPLKTLLYQAPEPVLEGTKELDGQLCYQVGIQRPEGKHLLWIDVQSLVLRRIEYPIEELARQMAPGQQLEGATLIADFRDAQLNPPQFKPETFRFEPGPTAQVVEQLMEPVLRMLGKQVPDFKFVDLDGKEITPKSLAGKTAVVECWATWCEPCRMSLPLVEKVYEEYKTNDKVTFLAVSVDDSTVPNDQLRKVFGDLKVNLPIARDPDQHVGKLFHSTSIPTLLLIGSNGVVQYAESAINPKLASELRDRVAELLDGRDLYPQVLARAEDHRKNSRSVLEAWIKQGLFLPPSGEVQEIPKAQVAPASEPKAFTLKSLWKTDAIKDPGNILAVPREDGSSQVFVLDGAKNVAEVGPDGKVVANHSLELDEQEVATFLRSAVDGKKNRYFAVSAPMQMRAHLLDQNWKKVCAYPADALKNQHSGIYDVELADMMGDGTLEMCVRYAGVLGIQLASLDGKRLWSNRDVDLVTRVAVLDPDSQGKRSVLATNARGSLLTVDSQGKSVSEVFVPETAIQCLVAADLDGNAPQELCGISVQAVGVCDVVGFNLKGERLWNYSLPKGVLTRPVDLIVPGRLKSSGPGQWLVPAADGSIHVIGADGKPIDHFQYGAELHGLATAQLNGQPVLLVSSAGKLEAFAVTWPNP